MKWKIGWTAFTPFPLPLNGLAISGGTFLHTCESKLIASWFFYQIADYTHLGKGGFVSAFRITDVTVPSLAPNYFFKSKLSFKNYGSCKDMKWNYLKIVNLCCVSGRSTCFAVTQKFDARLSKIIHLYSIIYWWFYIHGGNLCFAYCDLHYMDESSGGGLFPFGLPLWNFSVQLRT